MKPGICRAVLASLATVLLSACGGTLSGLPSIEVQLQDTDFRVAAHGEIIASEALPIVLPSEVRMEFNVVWLAPEFSEVKKGDVIARFDDVQVQLDRSSTSLNVAKSDFKLAGTARTGKLERTRITHESERVDGERDISEANHPFSTGSTKRSTNACRRSRT